MSHLDVKIVTKQDGGTEGMEVIRKEAEELFRVQGQPLKPLQNQKDSLKHAGTLEENLVLIRAPKTDKVVKAEEDDEIEIHLEHHAG
jgi:hypothetical protein